ncbi:MAG: hypothetical protein COW00_15830 [Bdellovibrio sp. CG12_big_fil_rev_8_21_14_0_65_39_13]|nr:MAG: hypothetical protein COW78_02205 [Bdellovibrio sp. CG22_combo_CG10-13_8_21_14_all_39_27]PIQ58315.1 MAG: hypothetical protein COW00_15830 [Bdellovibrio sp. CG12_big_fil_rev_8_21_14_0_65_39_13]PIR35827.1 MAG: hypothetical protein COV37_06410 [Bdellovibrio sp. CG11_big_fil_rev_8_21_14_0_20_39_38]PJB54703.1 MAG: hypothetical protein CO099_00085 [Bdellovibrio sp. CG_4_9_14_3_um_filter_39_7]
MRLIAVVATLLLSFSLHAASLKHNVLSGKYHTGGTITVSDVKQSATEEVKLLVNYHIITRFFLPNKTGSLDVIVPSRYLEEQGYRDLQVAKSLNFRDARFTFLNRVNVAGYYDAYRVRIDPKSRKWTAVIIYHPDIPGVGWYSSEITILSNNYVLSTLLAN